MRADRLLSILLLLQARGRLKARDLAHRLEVSERTIHRDMVVLSAAGIPVTAERGGSGGWSLLEEYRTNLTGLTTAEVQALFLTTPARLLADLGLRHASEAGLIKLVASLPPLIQRDADFIRQRIYVDAAGWRQTEGATPCLSIVQQALWQERKLALVYQRGDGSVIERLVDPLGLVAKGSLWYLVAAMDGAVRSYRVSRTQQASISEQPCARPAGFDLAAYWNESTAGLIASLPQYTVTARADPAILPRMRFTERYVRLTHTGEREGDDWVPISLQCDGVDEACAFVLGFGPLIEVVEPRDLRDRVVQCAQGIVSFYAKTRTDFANEQFSSLHLHELS